MNTEQFAYWLRGAVESRNFDNITLEEAKTLLKSIQDHSKLPFKKVTPERKDLDESLNELIKKAAQKPINPNGIGVAPLPYTPAISPSDYWLRQHNIKPGELYC